MKVRADDPFRAADRLLTELKPLADAVIVEIHADGDFGEGCHGVVSRRSGGGRAGFPYATFRRRTGRASFRAGRPI